MNTITLWALESDYDAEAIHIIAKKILSENELNANIQAHGKPKRAIAKKGKNGLKDAVKNYLKESDCVIFVIDRDGPMSNSERVKQPNSLINQVKYVLSLSEFTGKVHLVKAVNELESWLLVDCIGIFGFFSQNHHSLPKECKDDILSEKCREVFRKNNRYWKVILKYSVGDTTKIEEPKSGGRGAKEHLTSFSKEIYELHHDSKKVHSSKKYAERMTPDIAKFIKLNSSTIDKNWSLKNFSNLVLGCATQPETGIV